MEHITTNVNLMLSQMEPALGPNACANLLEAYQFAESAEEREEAVQDIIWQYNRIFGRHGYRTQIICPPPKHTDLEGDYPLVEVLYAGKRYGTLNMEEIDWTRHAKILGMTGAGKTRFLFKLLDTMNDKNKNWLTFDPSKREFRDLLQHKSFEGVRVFTVGTKAAPFYYNPLIPPKNVNPQIWLMKVIEVLGSSCFLGAGVEYFLRNTINKSYEEYAVYGAKLTQDAVSEINKRAVEEIDGSLKQLYKDYGVYDGKARIYPTFKDLHDNLAGKSEKGRKMLWHDSAMRCLDLLTFGGLGESLNVRHHGDFYKNLVETRSIVELDGLITEAKAFIPEMLITGLFEHFKINGERQTFNFLIVVDEAHQILSNHKERALKKETPLEQYLRTIRGFGVGLVILDQQPSRLSSSVKANTNLTVLFNLCDGHDIRDVSMSLELSPEERSYISMLRPRHCLVKIKDRFPNLLYCKTFDFEHQEGVISNSRLREIFHKKPKKKQKPLKIIGG